MSESSPSEGLWSVVSDCWSYLSYTQQNTFVVGLVTVTLYFAVSSLLKRLGVISFSPLEGARRRCELLQKIEHDLPEALRMEEGFYLNADGKLLWWRCFVPKVESKNKKLVCFCNGFCGNTDWEMFDIACRWALTNNCRFFVYDHKGHGRSYGKWMSLSNFEILTYDAREILRFAKQKFGGKEVDYFLMGASMGGAIALEVSRKEDFRSVNFERAKRYQSYGEETRWNGCVVLAPMVAISLVPPKWQLCLLRFLNNFWPNARLLFVADTIQLAVRCPKKRAHLMQNPLRWRWAPRLCSGMALLKETQKLERHLDDICIPLLVLHGAADGCTDPRMSEKLFEECQSKDKSIKVFDDMFHHIQYDDDCEQVFAFGSEWMEARCGAVFRRTESQLLSFDEKTALQQQLDTATTHK